MIILGVSFDYHDAAAALVDNGEVVCAIQEERLSRIKHDPSLPICAIKACLTRTGIVPEELDAVVFYEDPLVKFDRICRSALVGFPSSIGNFFGTLRSWTALGKIDPRRRLSELLHIDPNLIFYSEHHRSHAASAFYCSPFDSATVVTLDGVGEYETAAIYSADKGGIRRLTHTKFPNSLGLFYSAFTAYLGFEVNEGEYKVMGMAAYGTPRYYDAIRALIWVSNGRIRVNHNYFNFRSSGQAPFTQKLIDLIGSARSSSLPLSSFPADLTLDPESVRFADIAASLQKVTEEVIYELVCHAMRITKLPNLCMAGGVALNSLANGRLQAKLNTKIYIQPSAGDAGGAIGAALLHYHESTSNPKKKVMLSPYLGLDYSEADVLRAVRNYNSREVSRFETEKSMIDVAAQYLAEGKVIGWMQGRFEWGPRALGARSILASPIFPDIKDRVNRQIKFREPFRPFAPSVLAELADEYFHLPYSDYDGRLEDFMLSVCPVREHYKSKLPAIVHVDGTARVQTVRKDLNKIYYDLIERVGELTGVPMVLNTSFNLRGEPIVSSPEDAIQTFEWSELDFLVMGNIIVSRPNSAHLLERAIARHGSRRGFVES
jgi:carbamoyltransferase